MSKTFVPSFGTSGIGSLPLAGGAEAVKFVLDADLDFPFWPQLPRRGFQEQMIPQYAEGMPAVVMDRTAETTRFDSELKYEQLAAFYEAYMEDDPARFAISPEVAEGLHAFLADAGGHSWRAVKGQVTGPITFGTGINDPGKSMLYSDPDLRDAAVKLLARKAQWQVAQLRTLAPDVIVMVDEPVLSAFGSSAYVGISDEDVIALEGEIFEAIRAAGGLSGIHVCGNSDWSVIIRTGVDILNFDAYRYGPRLALYAEAVQGFLGRGGCIAWGLVPTTPEELKRESCESLVARLKECVNALTARGIPGTLVRERSMLTPCCGCGSLTPPEAARVFALLRDLRAAGRNSL